MTTAFVPRTELAGYGLSIPLLSLGSWHIYDRIDFSQSVQLIKRAIANGINLFDVGVYGQPGMPPVFTDVIFSAAIRAAGVKRQDYLLSEKLWLEGFDADKGFRPQLETALKRVGSPHADIAILGDVRRDDLSLRDLVLSLAEMKKLGLIRAWGVNNWSAENVETLFAIAEAENVDGPVWAQLKYSVSRRAIPDGAPFGRLFEQGLKLQSSDVMEGGILVKPTAPDREVGRDPGNIRDRIIASAAPLAEIARTLDATPAAVCIAFTLSHPHNITTLFGASRIEQLDQAIAAIALLDRVGAPALRQSVEPLWADRDIVDPRGP